MKRKRRKAVRKMQYMMFMKQISMISLNEVFFTFILEGELLFPCCF